MTKIEELELIANRIVEGGGELPPFATLGKDAWVELMKEFSKTERYTLDGKPSGYTQIGLYLSAGYLNIRPSPHVPPDFVGIGRMSMYDIIIEDILLDDETHSFIDSDV